MLAIFQIFVPQVQKMPPTAEPIKIAVLGLPSVGKTGMSINIKEDNSKTNKNLNLLVATRQGHSAKNATRVIK